MRDMEKTEEIVLPVLPVLKTSIVPPILLPRALPMQATKRLASLDLNRAVEIKPYGEDR